MTSVASFDFAEDEEEFLMASNGDAITDLSSS
jgi:hypothetical protein